MASLLKVECMITDIGQEKLASIWNPMKTEDNLSFFLEFILFSKITKVGLMMMMVSLCRAGH